MYYPILLLISFLIFKIFHFKFELSNEKLYTISSFIKESPLNIERLWCQIKNPKFIIIKSLCFFCFYIVKPFQLVFGIKYFIYFVYNIFKKIKKENIIFDRVIYKKKVYYMLFFYLYLKQRDIIGHMIYIKYYIDKMRRFLKNY